MTLIGRAKKVITSADDLFFRPNFRKRKKVCTSSRVVFSSENYVALAWSWWLITKKRNGVFVVYRVLLGGTVTRYFFTAVPLSVPSILFKNVPFLVSSLHCRPFYSIFRKVFLNKFKKAKVENFP